MKYEFHQIEKKWQKVWEEQKVNAAVNGGDKPKFYALVEFPYPSGDGLHVGHPRPYTALDIVSRKRRMEGYNVLFPIGFDAFGLPTENFAIKNHVHPREVTKRNIARFTDQLKMLGFSFDWDRVVDTTDPEYYKWTQWIFLQMFKKGLAYKTKMPVNWCTSCKCVLANEEVVNGVCERCGSPVVRREKSQWMLAITKYAQRLIDDLDDLDYIERVKIQQRNWIGRSTGAEVSFQTTAGDEMLIFTTRPDTMFGATYMVMSPEHELLKRWEDKLTNLEEVRAYQAEAARKSDFERTEMNKEKTGVRLKGVAAINPVTGEAIPIFISDYLMVDALDGAPGVYSARYGGGHDRSDAERNALLLKNLENEEHRAAKFVSVIAVAWPDGRVITARGEVHGEIAREERGANGFGYDPLFLLPDGRHMAQLSSEEKNGISHRGNALRELKRILTEME